MLRRFLVSLLLGAMLIPAQVWAQGPPVNTELPAAAALADNMANPTVPGVGSFMMCWDGATWDRCTGGGIVTQATGTNLHTVVDSGTITLIQSGNQAAINASGRLQVEAVIETSGGTELTASAVDTDDGSIAASQTSVGLALALNHCFDGSVWGRCATGAGNVSSTTLRVTEAADSAMSAGVGGTGDSAATAGSTGSINAKLRFLTNVVGVEDVAETAGGGLAMAGSVRRDVAAASAGTTGDNATINTDALGLMWTRGWDPCSAAAKTYIAINISTATTTELTAALAGASTNYYVCSLNLVTLAANNVALVDDDTDNCASVTSGLAGGLTAASGWNFGANGGIAIGNGQSSVFRTAGTNRVLCLVTSAATQLSGNITVVAAP